MTSLKFTFHINILDLFFVTFTKYRRVNLNDLSIYMIKEERGESEKAKKMGVNLKASELQRKQSLIDQC